MERPKHILTILILLLLKPAFAQYNQQIYNAYITNNMGKWRQVINHIDKIETKSAELLLELINYEYGYVAWCIGQKKWDEAELYISKAETRLEYLDKIGYEPALVQAYKSSFYGYLVGVHWYNAPVFGPMSLKYINSAIKSGPTIAMVQIQYANALLYMPAAVGGSKSKALGHFLIAHSLFGQSNISKKTDWNYLSLLTSIAQTYSELGNYAMANAYYNEILKIEPQFLWVKNELYPALIKKMSKV